MAKVNPIQLQKALKGVNYPADKQQLVDAAKQNGGDQNIMDTISRLPERKYNKPSDVSEAVGDMEWKMSNPSLQKALEYDFRSQEEENREKVHRERPDVDNVTITPSQAEGDRETVERDLGEDDGSNFGGDAGGGQGQRQPTPSQAEGDRQEIERDLREKNSGGHA